MRAWLINHCGNSVVVATCVMLVGCQTQVNLALHNPEPYALDVRLAVKEAPGEKGTDVSLGTVKPKETINHSFRVKHGGAFDLYANIPGSAAVYKQVDVYVGAKPDPLEVRKDIAGVQALDDSSSFSTLLDSFKKLGPSNLPQPVSIPAALQSLVGALVVITPGTKDQDAVIHATVTPSELGVRVVSLQDFLNLVNDVQESNSVDITSDSVVKASATLPTLGTFGFSFNASEVFKLDWMFKGFGVVLKPEDADKNYVTQYGKLPEARRKQLEALLQQKQGAKMLYINSVYALKRAELSVTMGTKMGVNEDASAVGGVATANGAYKFNKASTQKKYIENVILNITGDEMAPTSMAVTGTITTPTGKPAPVGDVHALGALQHAFNSMTSMTAALPKRQTFLMPTGQRYVLNAKPSSLGLGPGIAITVAD
jgi:hypothetical protein